MDFAGFEIAEDSRELRVDGLPVVLGGRAFDVAHVLVEAQGRLVSKDDMLRRVWRGSIVEENNLQVAIAALRKALGPRRGAIRTVSGRGYQIVDDRLQVSTQIPSTNLSAATGSLVGRDRELAAVDQVLRTSRIVTLTGIGGIGKTRMALEVARRAIPAFADGVWVAELASLSDSAGVAHEVAAALGLDIPDNLSVPGRVAAMTSSRAFLLVLDNCEHVVDAAAEMAHALVSANPHVRVLATSREPLRADGESLYRVTSLATPPDDLTDAFALMGFGAVQLFVARSRALDPAFPLDAACIEVIATICRRLDGIPLAIEIAAARAAAHGVAEIAKRLDDTFRLLTGGFRTALPRHRTLKAAFDWSYDLLSDSERQGLRHLSLFVGRFSLAMAEAILAHSDGDPPVIETVAGLVAKSLVVPEIIRGTAHYRLLETTRAYARERLRESGDLTVVSRRHANLCLGALAQADHDWQGHATSATLASLADPMGNIRAALDWTFSPAGDPALGVALTVAAAPLWLRLSMVDTCNQFAGVALAALPGLAGDRRQDEMRLHTAQGMALLSTMAMGAEVRAAFIRAHTLAEALDDPDYRLRALWGWCSSCLNHREFVVAHGLAQQLHARAIASKDESAIMSAELLLGGVKVVLGDDIGSRPLIERVLVCRDVPVDQPSSSRFLFNRRVLALGLLGSIVWHAGEIEQSRRYLRQSIDEALARDHVVSLCITLANWVCTHALLRGDFDEAERTLAMLRDYSTRYELRNWRPYVACFEGALAVGRGELDVGLRLFRDIFVRTRRAADHPRFATLRAMFIETLARKGEFDEANATADEAIDMVERASQLRALPHLLRVKAEVVFRQRGEAGLAETEALLGRSLELARRGNYLSFQLRTATSLATLPLPAPRRRRALALLSDLYGRFTDGFDTIDLTAARALLKSDI